jgi:hypothetical protein
VGIGVSVVGVVDAVRLLAASLSAGVTLYKRIQIL